MSFSHTLSSLAFVLTFLVFSLFANAHQCSQCFQTEAYKINITQSCTTQTLGAEFAWNFNNKSRRLDIAFGARLHSDVGWLAWGLNPIGPHMVGTRALIGIKHQDGSLESHMYNITENTKLGCQLLPSKDIGLDVRNFSFVYLGNIKYFMIRATVFLPPEYNSSRTNVVWQIGEAAAYSEPKMHPKTINNFDSAETVDLISYKVSYKAHQLHRMRTAHGILSIVGWGTLLPIGVIISRYFRVYPWTWSWWFVFHVSCQSVGYIIGTIGWATGLWLGNDSKYYCFCNHRIIGIIIFTFSTIQMMALRLKPKYADKYRSYWNMYHLFLGYALLTLISVNIFKGIKILRADHTWKWAYIGLLGFLGAVALIFELCSWIKFFFLKVWAWYEKKLRSSNALNLPQQGAAVKPQPKTQQGAESAAVNPQPETQQGAAVKPQPGAT